NKKSRFAGISKPSSGLEPETPSLPSERRSGKRGHAREAAGARIPQGGRIRERGVAGEDARARAGVPSVFPLGTTVCSLRQADLRDRRESALSGTLAESRRPSNH